MPVAPARARAQPPPRPRAAPQTLRARLADPGAHLTGRARRLTYLHRAAASIRRVRNEAALLEAVSALPPSWRLGTLSDAPPTPLHEAIRRMRESGCVLGTHGAGWANLLFAGPGTVAMEMALPEPHAIYAAHLAYALDMRYVWRRAARGCIGRHRRRARAARGGRGGRLVAESQASSDSSGDGDGGEAGGDGGDEEVGGR